MGWSHALYMGWSHALYRSVTWDGAMLYIYRSVTWDGAMLYIDQLHGMEPCSI